MDTLIFTSMCGQLRSRKPIPMSNFFSPFTSKDTTSVATLNFLFVSKNPQQSQWFNSCDFVCLLSFFHWRFFFSSNWQLFWKLIKSRHNLQRKDILRSIGTTFYKKGVCSFFRLFLRLEMLSEESVENIF